MRGFSSSSKDSIKCYMLKKLCYWWFKCRINIPSKEVFLKIINFECNYIKKKLIYLKKNCIFVNCQILKKKLYAVLYLLSCASFAEETHNLYCQLCNL